MDSRPERGPLLAAEVECVARASSATCVSSGAANQLARREKVSSFRCKNLLAARSVPILFILVCFLLFAHSSCDQAGATNVDSETSGEHAASADGDVVEKLKASDLASLSNKDLEALEAAAAGKQGAHKQAPAHKLDPLSMLREIYLDQNSKIITMMMPESETVQKFHPNGRYGRRSVDNFAEQHAELGKLIYKDEQAPGGGGDGAAASDTAALRAILRSVGRGQSGAESARSAVAAAHARSAPAKYPAAGQPPPPPPPASGDPFGSNGAQVANYQLEMNKLLKCNYTGISNLYWCDATGAGA